MAPGGSSSRKWALLYNGETLWQFNLCIRRDRHKGLTYQRYGYAEVPIRAVKKSFPAASKPDLSPTHVQSIRACLGCCWGQMQVSRVYVANLLCKWFGRLSLMPDGCLYSLWKWGEFHWALLPEPKGDQLQFKTPAATGERALAEGFSSFCLLLRCKPRVAPTFIASQREKHPRNPVTYSVQRSLPLKHLQFVPCAVFVCHMSREIREKVMYTKKSQT